jgi:hypothetical protein
MNTKFWKLIESLTLEGANIFGNDQLSDYYDEFGRACRRTNAKRKRLGVITSPNVKKFEFHARAAVRSTLHALDGLSGIDPATITPEERADFAAKAQEWAASLYYNRELIDADGALTLAQYDRMKNRSS